MIKAPIATTTTSGIDFDNIFDVLCSGFEPVRGARRSFFLLSYDYTQTVAIWIKGSLLVYSPFAGRARHALRFSEEAAMERTPEPELMDDDEQARAYSEADFSDAHNGFVKSLEEALGESNLGSAVLDLGCGPADATVRVARAFPDSMIHGLDGSKAMLKYGDQRLSEHPDEAGRIELVHGLLPRAEMPREAYDAVISNSLLHHLPDPQILWNAVSKWGGGGAFVFIMDLMRPATAEGAQRLVDTYASGEPEVLRTDFYNSLHAAFEMGEVEQQIKVAGLSGLSVRPVSDRHFVVSGHAATG